MIALVQILQLAAGIAWCVPLALFTPALWRVLRKRAALLDMLCAPHWFVALVMVLGSARWMVFSGTVQLMRWDELGFWAAIYMVNVGAGIGVAWSQRIGARLRGPA